MNEASPLPSQFPGYTENFLGAVNAAEENIDRLLGKDFAQIQEEMIRCLEAFAIETPFRTGQHDQLLRLGIREALAKLYEGTLNPCTLWADPRFACVPELQALLRRFDPAFQQDLLIETLVEAMNLFCPGAPN